MIKMISKFKSRLPNVVPYKLFHLHYQLDSRFMEDKITDAEFYKRFFKLIFQKRKYESQDFFKPDILIDCLPNLKLKDRYTIDFVYQTANRIGFPLLYFREINVKPFIKIKQYENWLKKNSILDCILVDGTKDSFIQLVIFMELGNKFFLHDHALYNINEIVVTLKDFNDLIKKYKINLEPNELEKFRNLNFNPDVEFINEDEVKVTYYTFTEFGGLIEKQKIFSYENKLFLKLEFEKYIINFNSGVMY